MHSADLSLSTQNAFGSHFAGDTSDLAAEDLQLIHHRVDGDFEGRNFIVHFSSLDLDSFGQIAIGNLCDDATDLTQSFLERLVCLLVFPQLPLQDRNVFIFHPHEGLFGLLFRIP
ncbi:hypothetical protein FOPE_01063 [Fonsecaea pedrosoi]|nr:hypothetical protein FOPE_01063 [Fonsecaea pedrosoi]